MGEKTFNRFHLLIYIVGSYAALDMEYALNWSEWKPIKTNQWILGAIDVTIP